jgi:hypothetical protein
MTVTNRNEQPHIRDVLDRLQASDEPRSIIPPNALNSVSTKPLQPPSFGEAQRDAVSAIVGNMTDELHKKIVSIRGTLDKIEQEALQSAANAKGLLNDHIIVCVRLNDEIERMGDVVAHVHDLIRAD